MISEKITSKGVLRRNVEKLELKPVVKNTQIQQNESKKKKKK